MCQAIACPSVIDSPKNVNIRQASSDGWLIENMQLQTYPGSSDFITYSLDGQLSPFWVDGDDEGSYDSPACTNGKWCNLKTVGSDGNPIHIL